MHRTAVWIRALTVIGLAATGGAGVAAQETGAAHAAGHYDFKIGTWDIIARSMQPDQSLIEGRGTVHVSYGEGGHVLYEQLYVDFEGIPDACGVTMRTYDAPNAEWNVTWFQCGAGAGAQHGKARLEDGELVERWPEQTDSHGAYGSALRHSDVTATSFREALVRSYDGGPEITIWQYEARRSDRHSR